MNKPLVDAAAQRFFFYNWILFFANCLKFDAVLFVDDVGSRNSILRVKFQ